MSVLFAIYQRLVQSAAQRTSSDVSEYTDVTIDQTESTTTDTSYPVPVLRTLTSTASLAVDEVNIVDEDA